MKILSIDPGNIESAYCVIDSETYKPLVFDKTINQNVMFQIKEMSKINLIDELVIEMIASYRYECRTNCI